MWLLSPGYLCSYRTVRKLGRQGRAAENQVQGEMDRPSAHIITLCKHPTPPSSTFPPLRPNHGWVPLSHKSRLCHCDSENVNRCFNDLNGTNNFSLWFPHSFCLDKVVANDSPAWTAPLQIWLLCNLPFHHEGDPSPVSSHQQLQFLP